MENQQPQQPEPKSSIGQKLIDVLGAGVTTGAFGAGLGLTFRAFSKMKPVFNWRKIGKDFAVWGGISAIYSITSNIFGVNKGQKHEDDVARNMAAGTIGGAAAAIGYGFVDKSRMGGRTIAITAMVGGAIQALITALPGKKALPTSIPSSTLPHIPPTQTDLPQTLALAQIPQILDILVADKQLTPEQQAHVLDQLKQGRKGFAAEIAVADGFVTQQQAETALGRQAMMKAEAAVTDIQNIKDHGALGHPAFLKANWGNNGVNPAATHPTRTDGVSAAANAAQNLVMLANANPALAPVLFDGVIAAASLANGIALGNSAVTPIAKMHHAWLATMDEALRTGAKTAPQAMTDANGKPIDIQQFIAARNAEITAAVQQTLQQPPERGTGTSR